MRVKHTRSDMPKPVLDAPMDEFRRVTLNSLPPKEWRYLKKREAAIAKRKHDLSRHTQKRTEGWIVNA